MGKIMKVAIEVNGEVIWYRDSETLEGMASLGYLKDGTQQKIIAALEEALFQAKGQLQISDTSDAPPAQTISASISIDTREAQSQLDSLISLLELKFGSLQPVSERINQELFAVAKDIVFADSPSAGSTGLDIVYGVRFGAKYELLTAAIRAGEFDSEFL